MAIQIPPRRSIADDTAEIDAAAAAIATAPIPQKKRKSSRRIRLVLFSLIPVVAIAVGAVSASVGLIGSKKPAAQTPAQQATALLNAGLAAQGTGDVATATSDYN
ncbi:MAG: hypothetical protein ACREQ5_27875, partial [Candidatus Dormibacteria bacterium]